MTILYYRYEYDHVPDESGRDGRAEDMHSFPASFENQAKNMEG